MTFVDKEGRDWTFEVADGDNLLDIAQANDLEMEGACGGSCACSTCHVIVADDAMYDKMVCVDGDSVLRAGKPSQKMKEKWLTIYTGRTFRRRKRHAGSRFWSDRNE